MAYIGDCDLASNAINQRRQPRLLSFCNVYNEGGRLEYTRDLRSRQVNVWERVKLMAGKRKMKDKRNKIAIPGCQYATLCVCTEQWDKDISCPDCRGMIALPEFRGSFPSVTGEVDHLQAHRTARYLSFIDERGKSVTSIESSRITKFLQVWQ